MRTLIGILWLLSVSWGMAQVTNLNDAGPGSLREAIDDANSGDTITFDASLSGGTITLTGGELSTNLTDLTIDASALANPITIDADNNSRVFRRTGNGTFTINNLIIINGNADGGGGIFSLGNVTVINSTISDNSASNGGGVFSFGNVTATNSTISNNSATSNGGGIFSLGSVTATNSTISGNSANRGGGIYSGNVTLNNSTILGNSAGDAGGGVFSDRTITVTNSTISGNSANNGGGIFNNSNNSTITVTNSTISGNSADLGGGIFSAGNVTLNNSLVLGNIATALPQIFNVSTTTLNSSAYGFAAGESTGDSFVGFGIDDVFTNPVAAASAPTTAGDYTLKACSPAINAGNNGNAPGGTDLAGNTRIQNVTVDMGAFESNLRACQTIDFDLTGLPAKTVGDSDFDISGFASASSGLPVAFTSDTTAVCTIAGSTVTLVKNGTCTINANQAGNAEYEPATQVQQSFTVNTPPATTIVNKRDDTNDGRCDTADCSLREAIANAADGDTITFDVSGTINLNSTLDVPQDDLTIDASGQNVVVSGQNSHRVLHHTGNGTFEVVSLEVTRGNTTGEGGGGIHSRGNVTVTNSTISGNSARFGGGIHSRGNVTVTNSAIAGNEARAFGGGVSSEDTVTVTESTFSGNEASRSGGGIHSIGNVTVTNSTISRNTANLEGGGIFSDRNVTLNDSTILGNSADVGGGIRSRGNVTITNSTISRNTANLEGGGVVSFGDVTVDDSTISGNSADVGGGIFSRGNVNLSNSTISSNSADDFGGGIYGSVAVTVSNSTILGNEASRSGGGMRSDGTVTLNNSTISGNEATNGDGGGIYSTGNVTLNNSTISGNEAGFRGGGIVASGLRDSVTVTLTNSLVLGNAAPPPNPQIVADGDITLNNSAYGFTAGESTGDSFVGFGIDDVFTNPVAAASAPTTAGDYTLKACSPAINAGNNGNALGGIDLAGNTRIQQGTVDMGAFESTLKACQTIDFDLSTLPIKAVGDADFDISGFASASSGLAVTFSSATTGVCTVAGSTVTILAVGTCTINADQAGNAEYQAAPQVQQSFTVNASGSVINPNQDIQVRNGATTAADAITSGTIEPLRYGTYKRGEAVVLDFLVRNPGAKVLELGELSLPSFFSNAGEPLPETLDSFERALLTVEVDTSTAGTFTGQVSLASNDPDAFENPFVFDVVVTVSDEPANAINVLPGVDLDRGNISAGQQDVVLLSFKVDVPAGSVPVDLEGIVLSSDSVPNVAQASNLRLYIDGGTRGVLDNRDVFVAELAGSDLSTLTFTFPTRTFQPDVPMWFVVVGDF